MCKAVSESLLVEKSKYIQDVKFVCVRYGNVLNSRGSIIPMLHEIGKNTVNNCFLLTDKRMTRFVMTLEQSVDLIQQAILHGESGDIVIPKLISCKISDLFEIFSEIYNKPIVYDKLRPGEKMLESLINETQSMRLITDQTGYMYIKPVYKNIMVENEVKDYMEKLWGEPEHGTTWKGYRIKTIQDNIDQGDIVILEEKDLKKYNPNAPPL